MTKPLGLHGKKFKPGNCSVPGCERALMSGGLCGFHRLRKSRGVPLDQPERVKRGGNCSRPNCPKPAWAKGLCITHHGRTQRGETPLDAPLQIREHGDACTVTGCDKPYKTKGMCNAHYKRSRDGRPLDVPLQEKSRAPKGQCAAPNCSEPARVLTFCKFHYHRQNRGTAIDAPRRGPRKEGSINAAGYRRILVNGYQIFEHRAVMESCLGRQLLDSETVHHKNGERLDNRLKKGHETGGCKPTCCNLELWSKSQPPGQRVADKVTWAREILALYGPLFPEGYGSSIVVVTSCAFSESSVTNCI